MAFEISIAMENRPDLADTLVGVRGLTAGDNGVLGNDRVWVSLYEFDEISRKRALDWYDGVPVTHQVTIRHGAHGYFVDSDGLPIVAALLNASTGRVWIEEEGAVAITRCNGELELHLDEWSKFLALLKQRLEATEDPRRRST